MAAISDPKRKSGINLLGDAPWGTHFCQFYRTKQDLIDILVPYFKAGLEDNEFCMWVTSEPLPAEEARAELQKAVKDLAQYDKKGQIEILDFSQWYTRTGKFDAGKVLQGWVDKEQQARKNGFKGLRLTGNTSWLEPKDWKRFSDYEAAVNDVIHKYNMFALCTYSLDHCDANQILDVFSTHQFALIKRNGKWAIIESTELKEAGEALQKREEHYRTLFEASTDAIFLLSPEGRILDANLSASRMFGYTRKELLSLGSRDLAPPEEAARVERIVDEEIKLCGMWGIMIESRGLKKDGTEFPLEVSLRVVPLGKEQRVLVYVRDITVRKRAEEALRESELRYRVLVDGMSEAVMQVDNDDVVQFANPQFCHLTGYGEDELLGRVGCEIYFDPDEQELIRKKNRLRLERVTDAYETRMRKKNGEELLVRISGSPVTAARGEVTGSIGVITDITARKRAEEALRESEERYRLLAENVSDVIWTTDLALRLTYISPADVRLTGYSTEEALCRSLDEILTPDSYEKAMQVFSEEMAREGSGGADPLRSRTLELEQWRKDGSTLWTEVTTTFLRDPGGPGGRPVGVLGITRDITLRRRLEEELRQAQKLESLGLLAGGIAHEFNNILGAILGYASLMKMKMTPEHPFWGYADTIEKSSQRAAELTAQLLGFARKGKYELRLLDLNRVAEDALNIVRQTFDRAIAVEARLAESLPKVEGDAMQLQQVLMNLAINARDAMPKGGSLVLTTAAEQLASGDKRIPLESEPGAGGLYVLISVADSGVGMDEETKAKIFEPFFTTKEKGKGTGLGLAMAYGVVKNHGGFITVQSEPGRGSVFTLYFPVSEQPKPSAPAPDHAPDIARKAVRDKGPGAILVVDDEEEIRSLARDALEDEGWRVLLAEDGEKALEIFRGHKGEIALVLLDLVMPKLGGQEVFLKLKELDPGVRVLVASGYSQEGKAQEVLASGAVGFIAKPFRVRALIQKVRQGLDGAEGSAFSS